MIISKENPKTLFVAAIIWIAILVLIFFPKNKNIVTTEQQSSSVVEQSSNIAENNNIESLLKNFTAQYNSYITGDFSNIENLYYLMNSGMEEIEMQRIEDKKKEVEKNTREYTTVESTVTEYKEIKKESDMIVAEIITEKVTFEGAFIPEPNSEDGLIICVDKNGNIIEENAYYSSAKKTSEAFQIVAMQENGEWKIAQIQKISE